MRHGFASDLRKLLMIRSTAAFSSNSRSGGAGRPNGPRSLVQQEGLLNARSSGPDDSLLSRLTG